VALGVGFGALLAFRLSMEAVGLVSAFRGGVLGMVVARPGRLVSIWKHWDVDWFSDIATRGYAALGHVVSGNQVQDAAAFPPAMPLLMRLGAAVGLPADVTGLAFGTLFLGLALALLYQLALMDFGPSVAAWTLAFLLVYPFALFLGTAYAESLVLLGAVGAWWAARRGRWWLAGLMIAAALLAKIVFVLLLVPLSLEAMAWHRGRTTRAPLDMAVARRLVGLWVPPLLGLAAWTLYQQLVLGSPLRFLTAQRGWGRAIGLPLGQVGLVFDPGINAGVRFIDAIDSLALVLLAVMTVYVYRRVRPAYGVFLGVILAVFTFNTSLISNGRHLAVLFPVFIGFAVWTARRPALRWLLVLAQLPLGVLLIGRFATGHWAG
jgi:hypothetical protein